MPRGRLFLLAPPGARQSLQAEGKYLPAPHDSGFLCCRDDSIYRPRKAGEGAVLAEEHE